MHGCRNSWYCFRKGAEGAERPGLEGCTEGGWSGEGGGGLDQLAAVQALRRARGIFDVVGIRADEVRWRTIVIMHGDVVYDTSGWS